MHRLIIVLIIFLIFPTNVIAEVTVTLSWNPPTTFTDGTPITDLLGFKIYWSFISGEYSKDRFIDVGYTTTYPLVFITDLNTIYYFVATAYIGVSCISDTGNIETNCESDYSNEVSKYMDGKPKLPTMITIIP